MLVWRLCNIFKGHKDMKFSKSCVPSSNVLKIPEAKEFKMKTQVCVFKRSLKDFKWDYFLVLTYDVQIEL